MPNSITPNGITATVFSPSERVVLLTGKRNSRRLFARKIIDAHASVHPPAFQATPKGFGG
jgi:hypothetical protein